MTTKTDFAFAPHRSALHGSLIAGGGLGLRMVLQFAMMVVLARLLAPADYGLVSFAAIFIGAGQVLAENGFALTVVQQRDWDDLQLSGFAIRNVARALVITAVLIVLAPLAQWQWHLPGLANVIRLLALAIPLSAIGRVHTALLQRQMRWLALEGSAASGIAVSGCAAVATYLLSGPGYPVLVAQSLVAAISTTLIARRLSGWRPQYRGWRGADMGEQHRSGLNLGRYGVLEYLQRQSDDWLVGARMGTVPLGHYGRAHTLLSMPLQCLTGPIGTATIPVLSRLQDDPTEYRAIFNRAFCAIALITLALQTLGLIVARNGVVLLLGAKWQSVGEILEVLLPSLAPAALSGCLNWIWITTRHSRTLLVWKLATLPIWIVALVIGSYFGVHGMALAWSAATIAILAMQTTLILQTWSLCHLISVRVVAVISIVVLMTSIAQL